MPRMESDIWNASSWRATLVAMRISRKVLCIAITATSDSTTRKIRPTNSAMPRWRAGAGRKPRFDVVRMSDLPDRVAQLHHGVHLHAGVLLGLVAERRGGVEAGAAADNAGRAAGSHLVFAIIGKPQRELCIGDVGGLAVEGMRHGGIARLRAQHVADPHGDHVGPVRGGHVLGI